MNLAENYKIKANYYTHLKFYITISREKISAIYDKNRKSKKPIYH